VKIASLSIPEGQPSPKISADKDQETHIRMFSTQIGEAIGKTITDLVAEFFVIVLSGKSLSLTAPPPQQLRR
jgi:hypothetical protein